MDRPTLRSLLYIANDLYTVRLRLTKTFMYGRTRLSEYIINRTLKFEYIFSRIHFISMTDQATDLHGHKHDYSFKQYYYVY